MITVGICADRHCFVPAVATLVSFVDAHETAITRHTSIRLLSPDIRPGTAETLASICRVLGFESFCYRRIVPPRYVRIVHGKYISSTTYLRFSFVKEFIRKPLFLYLDTDILITGDMTEPFNHLPHCALGAVRDEINHTVGIGPALPGFVEKFPRYRGNRYFNAGAMWCDTNFYEQVAVGSRRYIFEGQHIHFNDQDALNIWLLRSSSSFSVSSCFNKLELGRFLEESDWIRRVIRRTDFKTSPRAVHFVGPQKPWMRSCPSVPDVLLYTRALRTARQLISRSHDGSLDLVR